MFRRLDRAHRAAAVVLGCLTLAGTAALFVWDLQPGWFPPHAHQWLGAFPLALIALAYLVYQWAHRPPIREWIKAGLLAVAFLFWAANQFWPEASEATLFNDIAIGLFVLDVFLVMIGWPGSLPDESFGETADSESGPA
jgi:peptidoglycan/LPS O-acetylase OafA/YrhL